MPPEEKGALKELFEQDLGQYLDQYNAYMPDIEPGCDYKAQMDYAVKRNEGHFVAEEAQTAMDSVLKTFSPKQMEDLYDRVMKEEKREAYPLASLQKDVKERDPFSKNFLFDAEVSGRDWQETVQALEDLMTPEQRKAAVEGLRGLCPPTSEKYPKDRLVDHIQAEKIAELKANLPDGDQKEADAKLLDEVNEILTVPTQKTSAFMYHQNDIRLKVNPGGAPGLPKKQGDMIPGIKSLFSYGQARAVSEFMDRPENRENRTVIPTRKTDSYDVFYDAYACSPSEKPGVTEEDLRPLRTARSGISDKTLDTVKKMDAIFTELSPELDPDIIMPDTKKLPWGETLKKEYSFTPLVRADLELEKAVKDGDMEAIRKAHGKYRAVEAKLDKLHQLASVKEGQISLAGSNVDSTRAVGGGNRVPLKYQRDFVGHSRMNGAYLLHNICQASGQSMADLLKEPGKGAMKIADLFSQERGLRRGGTIGERLAWAADQNVPMRNQGAWGQHTLGCITRGFESVAGMAGSEKERQDILGAGRLAAAAASYEANRERELWEDLQKSPDGMKLMVQSALLHSDKDLDLLDVAEKFKEGTLSPTKEIEERIEAGTLDYGALADRCDEVWKSTAAALAAQNAEKSLPGLDQQGLSLTILGVCRKALELGASKPGPGMDRLRETVDKLSMEVGGREALLGITEGLAVQKAEKRGAFLSKTNSPEQQDMTRKQEAVRIKLAIMSHDQNQLQGVPPAEIARLTNAPLSKLVQEARDSTFEYVRLKTDGGRKSSFAHEVGEQRYNAAINSITALDRLADRLDLRSPAQKMIDEAKVEMMNDPRNENVAKECAAKIVLGQAMLNDPETYPPERQAAVLSPAKLKKGLADIQKSATFQRMVRDEGTKGLASQMMENPAKVYGSYCKAERKEYPKKYAELDRQEKARVKAEKERAKTAETQKKESQKKVKKKVKKTGPKAVGMD